MCWILQNKIWVFSMKVMIIWLKIVYYELENSLHPSYNQGVEFYICMISWIGIKSIRISKGEVIC